MVSVSILASPAGASEQLSVGVKAGDWMEYTVSITGPTDSPAHNITWFRIEILEIQDTAFHANVTVRNVNGSVSSSIWDFNLTKGQIEGWVIIPANLGTGATFYDSATPGNIAIEEQEQKNVAGATRTITHASDSERIVKEWDKATGVYTYSLEKPKNFTVISTATATNMWSPDPITNQNQNQSQLYALVGAGVVGAVLLVFSLVVAVNRKSPKMAGLLSVLLRRIKALTIILVIVVMGIALILFGAFQSKITMSFHEINLFMQTIWCGLLVASMWFRAKGRYRLHGIFWIVAVTITLLNFALVLLLTPPSSFTMVVFFTSPAYAAEFISHSILSFPALVLAVWFIVLWSPTSTVFVAKTRLIAPATVILWVLSYIAGVLGYIALYTNYFG